MFHGGSGHAKEVFSVFRASREHSNDFFFSKQNIFFHRSVREELTKTLAIFVAQPP